MIKLQFMKKMFIFIGGMITGAILMVIISVFLVSNSSSYNGMIMFEKEGKCISENSFEVFQVLDTGDALANELEQGYSTLVSTGLTVLFLCEEGQSYYDGQVIKIPSGKCAKQVGVYKYTSYAGMEKTVPIVGMRDK